MARFAVLQIPAVRNRQAVPVHGRGPLGQRGPLLKARTKQTTQPGRWRAPRTGKPLRGRRAKAFRQVAFLMIDAPPPVVDGGAVAG